MARGVLAPVLEAFEHFGNVYEGVSGRFCEFKGLLERRVEQVASLCWERGCPSAVHGYLSEKAIRIVEFLPGVCGEYREEGRCSGKRRWRAFQEEFDSSFQRGWRGASVRRVAGSLEKAVAARCHQGVYAFASWDMERWDRILTGLGHGICGLWKLKSKYPLLVQNTICLGLCTTQVIRGVPDSVRNGALSCYRWVGVISLKYGFQNIVKTSGDLYWAGREKDVVGVAILTLKVAMEVSGSALTLLGWTAAISSLLGFGDVTKKIYQFTSPWGLACIAGQVVLDFYQWYGCKSLKGRLKQYTGEVEGKRADQQKIKVVVQSALGQLEQSMDEGLPRCSQIRRFIEVYTLKEVENLASKGEYQRAYEKIIRDVEAKTGYAKAQIALRAYGYFVMALGRACPESALYWLAIWSTSFFYTAKEFYYMWKKEAEEWGPDMKGWWKDLSEAFGAS